MRRIVLAACTALTALPAHALGENGEFMAPRPDERSTVTVTWENDVFTGTDRNYTNGFRAAWLSGTFGRDGPEGWIAKEFFGVDREAAVRRGLAIGHSIYTPEDIEAEDAPEGQHPYAGWLYGEYSALIDRKDEVDQVTLQLGIVGPSAQGEKVQNTVHDAIGSPEARGWGDQIADEPGVVLSYDKRLRSVARLGDDDLGFDLKPSFGASLGNVHTNARVGLTARVGEDLRNDYGPPRVRPSLGGAGYFNPIDDFSWYLFAGVEGRAVAHNVFLDGSLFDEGSPSVDKRPFVADLQAGAVVQVGDAQLAFTYVERTDEFEGQGDTQGFGALSLSVKY